MDGTFIANRYDKDHHEAKAAKTAGNLRPITEEEVEDGEEKQEERTGGQMNSNKKSKRKKKPKTPENDAQFYEKIKTYITHNRGSSWELIRAPEQDMRGKSTNCYSEDGCSLNLNMYSLNE